MKFRSDFVTNSSSSSFVVSILISLKNGKHIEFEANGGTPETGRIDYFDGDAIISVSPKQLALAKDLEEFISLLQNGVHDCSFDRKVSIFEKSNPVKSDIYNEVYDAYEYIEKIRKNIKSMDDVIQVVIEAVERNHGEHYTRFIGYNLEDQEYFAYINGETFENNGSSGGDLTFDLNDCIIDYDVL